MKESELIVGARQTGEVIGIPARRVNAMYDRGEIPLFKLGGSLSIRRSALAAWLDGLESQGAATIEPVEPIE